MVENGEQRESLSVATRTTIKGALLGTLGFGEILTGIVVHSGGAIEALGFVTLGAAAKVLSSREGYDQQSTQPAEPATE